MNILIQKEIAAAEHRGEFDYAETLKALDSNSEPAKQQDRLSNIIRYQRSRARNVFSPIVL